MNSESHSHFIEFCFALIHSAHLDWILFFTLLSPTYWIHDFFWFILSRFWIHTVFHTNISNMADLRMKQTFGILVLDLQYGGFLLLFYM